MDVLHIPKTGDLKQCKNYIIALVSHASKMLLRIILERIRVNTETEIADKQAEFRQGRETRDQITNLRIPMHKAREHQQPLYMCFMDFKKAFDSISRDKLWVTVMDMEYPLHLIDMLAIQETGRRTLLDWFPVKKVVRQGCVLSPYLFNILAEMVRRETVNGFQGGLQIGGQMITNFRYANDIILLATSEAELDRVSCEYSLHISIDKTKVTASDCIACRILIQNEQLAQMNTFPYLGSLIT